MGGPDEGSDFVPHAVPGVVSTPPLEEHLSQVRAIDRINRQIYINDDTSDNWPWPNDVYMHNAL